MAAAVTIPVQIGSENRTIRPTPTANQEAAQMLANPQTMIHLKCHRLAMTDLLLISKTPNPVRDLGLIWIVLKGG
jgi:precorrin-2 methylase